MAAENPLHLDGSPLTMEDVESVARHRRPVTLAPKAMALIEPASRLVEHRARGRDAVYGLNTGFGSLSRQRIAPEEVREVQRNLVRSHAAGVGESLPEDIVRATMLVLAASLARGRSGVRAEVVEQILTLLNLHLTPLVPSRGSVGASGDLAPLAHIALALIGEGKINQCGRVVPGMMALRTSGVEAITLEAKEGLALINGTHLMTAIGAILLRDVERTQRAAICAATLAIDACRGTDSTLDPRVHEARRQPGQKRVAEFMRRLIAGSEIVRTHLENDPRVQDPYCLRAAPQVIGAAFDAIDNVRATVERELGAVTDNPLVFVDDGASAGGDTPAGDILSGANFHGMPLAIALDILPIALAHIAGIAERRVNWLLTASDSENPVNAYLSPQPGLHSGMMIAQYTAAACCNELQTLCTPASVANIPTSAGVEDYNSMGVTAAHQARSAVELARNVIAIELLVMAEALEYQRPLKSGAGVERAYETVRSVVPRLTADRPLAPDIEAIAKMIQRGAFDENIP